MFLDAVSRLGAAPLITYYDPESRIELSGTTFANWVMKTANLFDDLGGDADDPVSLGLAETHPGHWVTLIWAAAVWYAGGGVQPGVDAGADFAVVGPDDERRGDVTVACSLHPMGRGFEQVPDGASDYADVLAQPDAGFPNPTAGDAPAWGDVTHAELNRVEPRSDRRLFTDPPAGWAFVADALVAPLLGGGSSVVVVGMDEAAVERIRESERSA
ncbi:MAG: TIGR03089 family protein [Propionibacterium sp.]|nr:TIGR03089 family protein [Propionibacterium sp.]